MRHTPETKAKLAAIAQQRLQDPEYRARLLAISHSRQPASDETRAKIAAASRAQKHSPERRAKMAEYQRRRAQDPETGPNCRRTLKSNGANGVFAEASVEGEALNESIASIGRPAQANE